VSQVWEDPGSLTFNRAMAREETMNAKKFKEHCENIFGTFESLMHDGRPDLRESCNDKTIHGFLLTSVERNDRFIADILEKYCAEHDLNAGKSTEVEEALTDIEENLITMAFAFGYVIGQTFDVGYPEIQKEIETVKSFLKEKALLPYFPREKKAA